MKKITFFIFLIFYAKTISAQKKTIEFSTPNNWPFIENSTIKISNNGKYTCYIISPLSWTSALPGTLVVKPVDNSWVREIQGISSYGLSITQDSRNLLFTSSSKDSIGIVDLQKNTIYYIEHARYCKTPKSGDGRWLTYSNKSTKDLILMDIQSKKETRFHNVDESIFADNGRLLLLSCSEKSGEDNILLFNPVTGKVDTISHAFKASNFSFNNDGTAVAFIGKMQPHQQNALFYYSPGMYSARVIADTLSPVLKGLAIRSIRSFNSKNDKLFFSCQWNEEQNGRDRVSPNDQVQIRTYRDDELSARQGDGTLVAVIHLKDDFRTVLLQQKGDSNFNLDKDGEHAITRNEGTFLVSVSVNDGSRKRVPVGDNLNGVNFSPVGKYLFWFDKKQAQWFTYDINQGITKNITLKTPTHFNSTKNGGGDPVSEGVAGWLMKDEAIFLYDHFDIWKVDPKGVKWSLNLTQGYGKQNNIELRYLDFDRDNLTALPKNGHMLLWGFDLNKKYNRFFQLDISGEKKLTMLSEVPKVFYLEKSISYNVNPRFHPLKAKDADVFLLRGMNADNYPNLYISRDLKNFNALTELAPQKDYNWYTSELIHYPLSNGEINEGILYKPENFDPKSKYPVIFNIYGDHSQSLNFFIDPLLSIGDANIIPWFTSHGYAVFVPDIDYKVGTYKDGEPGKHAYDAVVSAANFLSNRPYIDSKHMAISGHSFGGFETNYIITRSHLFAAAISAAGVSDLIDSYPGGERDITYYEKGQGRIGSSLWEHQEFYIENSAILKADQVSTPLLIFHNNMDSSVPFTQGEHWFNALKRLRKKVWMISYSGENHMLEMETAKSDQLDYSIRLVEFLDHYLKGKPAPVWMTQGNKGYELDPGVEP